MPLQLVIGKMGAGISASRRELKTRCLDDELFAQEPLEDPINLGDQQDLLHRKLPLLVEVDRSDVLLHHELLELVLPRKPSQPF